jgi:hypothetical protein
MLPSGRGFDLTVDDLDWLRKLEAAADAKRDPPPIPMNIATKLDAFGLAKPNGLGTLTITSTGRDALLDQKMRDAEDR